MTKDSLIDGPIARALAPLRQSPEAFEAGVLERIAAAERRPDLPREPAGGRGWLAKAASWCPPGLLESSTLVRGVGGGAVKGGLPGGLFAVTVGAFSVAASLAALLAIGLFRVKRARREGSRPALLSDRMNYAEDSRMVGAAVLVGLFWVYVLFFATIEGTILIGAASLFGATLVTLITMESAGGATRRATAPAFTHFFQQAFLLIWCAASLLTPLDPTAVLCAAPIVLFVGCLLLEFCFTDGTFAGRIGSTMDSVLILALLLLGTEPSIDPAPTWNPRTWASVGFLGVAEWALFVSSVATVLLVILTVRDRAEDVFEGP